MIDDHAHPFPLTFAPLRLSDVSLDVAPDGGERRARQAGGRLFAELLTVRLAQLLGVDPAEAVAARDAAAQADWPGWVRRLLDDAAIEGIVLDGGLAPSADTSREAEQHALLAGRPIWELVRVDPLVDRLIGAGADASAILAAVRAEVSAAARRGAVGLKTILAYRTGLAVDPGVTLEQAQRSLHGDEPVRRRGKALRDLVLLAVLDLAAELDLPLQVHTGFGDSEIRLRESDPTLLEPLLHTPAGQVARIVLIHGSFPWIDAAAYLAASRANVYAELSLSNLFAPLHTADRLARLLDLAPRGKVLVGTDGHGAPETHWFAAHVLHQAWQQVAQRLFAAGARTGWLADTREALFTGNARACYRL